MTGFVRLGLAALLALYAAPAKAQAATEDGGTPQVSAKCGVSLRTPGEARKVMPCGNSQTWVAMADFADIPGAKYLSGRAAFRLDIDVTGKIVGCTVLASDVTPAMNARLCAVLTERGRFYPALLADGSPVASAYFSSLYWFGEGFGDGEKVKLASWSRTAEYEVNPGGRLVTCDVRNDGGEPGAPLYMCEIPSRYGSAWVTDAQRRQTRRFVRRVSIEVEGAPLPAPSGLEPDGIEVYRESFAFDVRADGSIPQCKRFCPLELGYLPLRRPARAVRTETIWLVEGGID